MLAAVDSESPALESAETPLRTSVFRIFEEAKGRKALLGGGGAVDAVAKDHPSNGQPATSIDEASASSKEVAKKLAIVAQKGDSVDDVPEETMPSGESEDLIGAEAVTDDSEDGAVDEDQSHMPFIQVEVS